MPSVRDKQDFSDTIGRDVAASRSADDRLSATHATASSLRQEAADYASIYENITKFKLLHLASGEVANRSLARLSPLLWKAQGSPLVCLRRAWLPSQKV